MNWSIALWKLLLLKALRECSGPLSGREQDEETVLTGKQVCRQLEPHAEQWGERLMRERQASIGHEIRQYRKRAGHTQESLAFEIGVERTTVGEWERGEAYPSASNMRILHRLGILNAPGLSAMEGDGQSCRSLTPEVLARIIETFECLPSELCARVERVDDDRERIVVAYFRMLSIGQQDVILEVISSMGGCNARLVESRQHSKITGQLR